LTIETQLFDAAVGAPELVKVESIKQGELLRLNVGTAVSYGPVTSVRGDVVVISLKRPVCAPVGSRVAVIRRIADRWRLIGSGTIK